MLKVLGCLGLVVGLAVAPHAARAQNPATAPGAQSSAHHQAHKPTRSHRSEMRRRGNMSRERARAGAEHRRTMRHH